MKTEEFQLESTGTTESLRAHYRALVSGLWADFEMERMTEVERRRIFRHERPQATYDSYWPYKVWREEVRRKCGLANGPLKRRTLHEEAVMPSLRDWARRHGLVLSHEPKADCRAEEDLGPTLLRAEETVPVGGPRQSPRLAGDESPGEEVAEQLPDLHL